MNVAIYSRRSKQSETGDSVASQVSMCKEYARAHFGACEFMIYEDEGFSGGNTDRPMFKRLMADVARKKVDLLVCYRLDRVSRNVANFSETLSILERHNVGFVSITEQFNTTIPMGRAMMYISSVFAQLERDTISERITDNLSSLAKSGRHLGFMAPQGYKKVRKTAPDGRQYNILAVDESECERIKLFFAKYLMWQSICKLEAFCLQNDYKTRRGNNYKACAIRHILTHPVYCAADKEAYEHFAKLDCQVYDPLERWDGTKGVAIYRNATHRDPREWLVGVGEHAPFIDGTKWIQVQNTINSRKTLSVRRPTGGVGIVNGVLRCKRCGDYMRPASKSARTGHFYYGCVTKETSRRQACDVKNIRGDIFDRDIVEIVQTLLHERAAVPDNLHEIKRRRRQISKNEDVIRNLVMKLADSTDITVNKYIADQIKALDADNAVLRLAPENAEGLDKEAFSAKRGVLRALIEKIVWDGERAEVIFNHFADDHQTNRP